MTEKKTLVELKAKIDDIDEVREKILKLNAKFVGKFRQIDTYFDVPKGRLKLREVEGNPSAQLIYYERENVAVPKKSEVFILEISKPEEFKEKTEKILEIKSVVEKIREIYFYKGTKIHLDSVKKLGFFIEFEKETSLSEIEETKKFLKKLMEKLEIKPQNLMKSSYGELILNANG
ncbi:hypothetical protein DRO54_02255 [Candidatus Bathyarchaeota archaeon]|nr:MAG: hypothetical protein DRO54_02255 [Candidatus Bathyarchaeota archaeon]